MIKFIAILFLSIPSIVHAEYKNTNGTALEKSFFEMLKWIRSDQEPVLTSIEISSQSLHLPSATNLKDKQVKQITRHLKESLSG